MRPCFTILALLAFALAACRSTESCPDGMHFDADGECVADGDAGTRDAGEDGATDSGADARGDAGPCGGACTGATPMCRASDGMCVACLEDAHCTDLAAPRCDTGPGACVPCDDSAQCADRTGTEVCDTTSGACVECTAAEASACGADPCTMSGTCSMFGAATQDPCEPCDTDDNCRTGHYCVPMRYMGTDRPGGYCLEDVAGGCDRPFSVATPARTTLSGATGMTFCGINETLATCEAVRALLDDAVCPGGTDAECPDGGLCRTVGVLANRCTYECGLAIQCPPSAPADTCGEGTPSAPPSHCGG